MNLTTRLGLNLRLLRQQAGWSQEELAAKAGLHRTYISGIERGVRNPTLVIVELIANALDVPAADLLQTPPEQ
jgi:transcriptional regulator with XRE-family HTH domain